MSVSTTPAQAESAPAANRAPTVVNAVEPVRPRPLMNFGASGTVEVTFTISAKGTVEKPIGNWIFQGDRIREGFAHDARTETEFPVKPAKILKQKIASGSLTLGALSTFHVWPGLVEIAKRAGLDYLIVDQEHFTHGHEKVAEICALGRLIDFPILIRPPAVELTHLRLAMDLGPCGLMLPHVESAADLAVAQDAVYLRPRGKRRPGGPGNRWVDDFNYAGWKTQVEDDLIILPQIESRAGLANREAIAAPPLTTAMAMGMTSRPTWASAGSPSIRRWSGRCNKPRRPPRRPARRLGRSATRRS